MERIFLLCKTGLVIAFFILSRHSCAQQADKNYFPTQNTTLDANPDPKKQKEKEKPLRFIIVNNTQGTLAGNLCFEEVTTKMGFQYLAIPEGISPNKNGFARWRHNFGVKFMLLLKNGPFWKSKVNKKYKDCKFGSGDFVG
jgi:hypothetical protein